MSQMFRGIHVKYQLFCSEFNKTRHIFENSCNIWCESVQWEPCCSKRTDRHDEANSRFSQCREKRLKIGSSLFWDFTQHRVVVPCRRFGTIYRPHLQRSRSLDRLSRNIGKELPLWAV